MVCCLKTETPLVVGADQIPEKPVIVKPFRFLTQRGEPEESAELGIPATSLKGMISSLAEAASNSALRCLEDTPYSRRAEMSEGLACIGMIREIEVKGKVKRRLLPLTLPALPYLPGTASLTQGFTIHEKLRHCRLRVYVDGYHTVSGKKRVTPGSFLDKPELKSFSSGNRQFWYAKFAVGETDLGTRKQVIHPESVKVKTIQTRNGDLHYFALGRLLTGGKIYSDAEWSTLESQQKELRAAGYQRCILRVLGVEGSKQDMPEDKKHEILIPYPETLDHDFADKLLNIDQKLNHFERAASNHSMSNTEKGGYEVPYLLQGMPAPRRLPGNKGKYDVRLADGDLVWFNLDADGQVDWLSVSSIWRFPLPSLHQMFEKAELKGKLPFSSKRSKISLAEQLFGFVDQTEKKEEDEELSLALAGRVRFSSAKRVSLGTSPQDALEPAVTLKVLNSPKPPCPSMYFNRDGYKSKADLEGGKSEPSGRKMYVPQNNDGQWRSTNSPDDRDNMRMRVTPIRVGQQFLFHIDFDNLSKQELSLLCYSLRPNKDYLHKLGLGKPLGLGSVRIEPVAVLLVDRVARYQAEDVFTAPRYGSSWKNAQFLNAPDTAPLLHDALWQERYASDVNATTNTSRENFEELRDAFRNSADPDIVAAIDALGKTYHNVHYPQLASAADSESEHFKWFVMNDKGDRTHHIDPWQRYLRPLSADSPSIQPLGDC
jgi:CRISPR-associated protein (TIGR03986 family)